LSIAEISSYRYVVAITGRTRRIISRGRNVIRVIDIKAELAKLTMFEGRRPTATDAEKNGAIARLAPYRDGSIFASRFAGDEGWERHPAGDEIVQIVDGATTLHLMIEDGPQCVTLRSGMMAIVPQGM
jgi:hypothetical protein